MDSEQLQELVDNAVKNALAEHYAMYEKTATPDLLTRKETAELLHITLGTLHLWTLKGKLKPKYIGRRILYDKAQVISALKDVDRLKYKRVA